MKKVILLIFLMSIGTWLTSQNAEIDGWAKILTMDPATASAQPVAREPDGTLSLMSSGDTSTYAVGDFVQGGVVFWTSTSGDHCKVVSIYDIVNVSWSNITNTEIGTGAKSDINGAGNTVAIIMQSGHLSSAALHCANLAYGGYDDWYLPSKDELNEIYSNKALIDVTALANGGEVFTTFFYWSSTEYDSSLAWRHIFSNDTQQTANKSSSSVRVRAVRAF